MNQTLVRDINFLLKRQSQTLVSLDLRYNNIIVWAIAEVMEIRTQKCIFKTNML